MTQAHSTIERIEVAFGALKAGGPRPLRPYLAQPGPDLPKLSGREIEATIDLLLSPDQNSAARLLFSNLLREWDNCKDPAWADGTTRNSPSRRQVIHSRMQSGPELQDRVDRLIPYYHLDEPLVIADDHDDWYSPKNGIRDYYWRTYVKYLRRRGWDDAALLSLDNHTRAIVECIANPEAIAAYSARGLVVGYVQSGKTANFIGVTARAADAGYRLVIVLAGTWNILRNQTQRRFDKELLGKELLQNDEEYTSPPPADWGDFLEHGTSPDSLGYFVWQRLTRPDIDFRRLRSAIDTLEFDRRDPAAPLFSPSNLHALPAKLLVVKKRSEILHHLVRDLTLLRTRLAELPTLIVDDESDQAGLNTVDPSRVAAGGPERSRTNQRIVDLLRLFPRGQYIGYTATPFANALIRPDDPEDLYPRDFILALDRAPGYMGISDFFDPTSDYNDLDKDDYSQPEIAHVRRVERPVGQDSEDLKKALQSYVLSGAIKLYRHARNPNRYRSEHLRHHTMLIHTSHLRGEMASIAARVMDLWDECAFNSPSGAAELERLWNDDYSRVSAALAAQGTPEESPAGFGDLVCYLGEAIKRIEKGPRVLYVVNSDTTEAPDFSAEPVWKIIVGGNKLSRGYTVEGLTVSYYRRVAGTADTLMQMGRWFGFRPGYRDLVRVFLGVAEGRRRDCDLVGLFKEVCRMEERFREDIQRYIRRPGAPRITPKQIPALIAVCGNLPPTARNKMFNSVVASKNFGGRVSMLTLAPAERNAMASNLRAMRTLMRKSAATNADVLGGRTVRGETLAESVLVRTVSSSDLIGFLDAYQWLEHEFTYPDRPTDAALQLDFLRTQPHGIDDWLVIAPQRRTSFGKALPVPGVGPMTVKERHRTLNKGGFQVFGEPSHRHVARYLAGLTPEPGKNGLLVPDSQTKRLFRTNRGVMLVYPVREARTGAVTVGFELFFPENDLPYDVNFTVRRKGQDSPVVVDAQS